MEWQLELPKKNENLCVTDLFMPIIITNSFYKKQGI